MEAFYEKNISQGSGEESTETSAQENSGKDDFSHEEDIAGYEVVFVGCPVWATDVPQAVLSFLNEYDLSGKNGYSILHP